MTFIDIPNKKPIHPRYEDQLDRLDKKNNGFSDKKFHRIRNYSTSKRLLESFGRIAMCLNNKTSGDIPTGEFDRVCLILINTHECGNKNLGVGPLKDGYLIGWMHHNLNFKIFYLYNPKSTDFTLFLGYFMQNTEKLLTVFYTGGDSATYGIHGIDFIDGTLHEGVVGSVIARNCNKKARVMFITDSYNGGSVFNIHSINYDNNQTPTNLISLSVQKDEKALLKEVKRSQGILTYYLCKIIGKNNSISPNQLIERINPSIANFNLLLSVDVTDPELSNAPIFPNEKE